MACLALPMGVDVKLDGVLPATLILVLGIGASHALGIVAAAVKLISKRGNPFVTLYGMARRAAVRPDVPGVQPARPAAGRLVPAAADLRHPGRPAHASCPEARTSPARAH